MTDEKIEAERLSDFIKAVQLVEGGDQGSTLADSRLCTPHHMTIPSREWSYFKGESKEAEGDCTKRTQQI